MGGWGAEERANRRQAGVSDEALPRVSRACDAVFDSGTSEGERRAAARYVASGTLRKRADFASLERNVTAGRLNDPAPRRARNQAKKRPSCEAENSSSQNFLNTPAPYITVLQIRI